MKNCSYYFLVLDIETSELDEDIERNGNIIKNPLAVWLSYGWIKLYKIDGTVVDKCYFREWFELIQYLSKIAFRFGYYKILCYVHNLSYEFDYLIKNIAKPKTILSNSTHSIISSVLENYENIEFRCTYQLSGYSLKKIGEMVGLPKLESDYRCIYPEDEITKEEIEYCERDCDIVAKYIVDVCLKEYGKLFNIPYTKTGRVRKVFKEFYDADKSEKDWDLMPDENCYQALLDSFSGGLVLCNPIFCGLVLNNVHSYDIKSSYPYAQLSEEYPYTIRKSINIGKNQLTKFKFWIAKIKFINIKSKYTWCTLSMSKMNDYDIMESVWFNGKLAQSPYIVRTITNIDFEILNMTYDYDDFEILEFYPLEKYGKLPEPYIKTIEHFSIKKYECGIELDRNPTPENEREYMLAKNDFNSIYGMCVQKIMQSEYTIDENFLWIEKEKEYKKQDKHLKRNFLYGIYITAYARRNLVRAIIKNCPYTFVYCDTDSIKFIGDNNFIDTNPPLLEYANNKSICKLGKFEYEGTYEKFKTFGAKKYCIVGEKYKKKDNKNGVRMVVAGLPKNVNPLDNIDEFVCGKLFENCKLAKKYINNQYSFSVDCFDNSIIEVRDNRDLESFFLENGINTNGGVALYPTSYLLDMTESDKWYTENAQKGLKNWILSYKNMNGIDLISHFNLEV